MCAKTDLTQTQGKLKDTEYNDHDSREEIEKLEKELSYQSRKHEKKITALQKQHEEKVHVHVYIGSLSVSFGTQPGKCKKYLSNP